jgi:uncharacterized Zn finger protein
MKYIDAGTTAEKISNEFEIPMSELCDVFADIPATDVQPVDRWISIEESKPKDMQQVLAVVDGDVREAFYNAGCFIGSNFYRSINEVKWWQPLPEPPKDGDAE